MTSIRDPRRRKAKLRKKKGTCEDKKKGKKKDQWSESNVKNMKKVRKLSNESGSFNYNYYYLILFHISRTKIEK